METSESKEMYLETIYRLRQNGSRARAIDVAGELGFSRPSVSNALKHLQKEGFVFIDGGGEVALTEKGMIKAASVFERHCVLKNLLMYVGADEKAAEDNACRIEHVLSDEIFELLKKFDQKTNK